MLGNIGFIDQVDQDDLVYHWQDNGTISINTPVPIYQRIEQLGGIITAQTKSRFILIILGILPLVWL